MIKSFDVIIIGSGPGGCSAAAIVAKAGYSVVIITDEEEQNILDVVRPEPLESIHPGVTSLLQKIDAAGVEVKATRAYYSGIYSGVNYAPLGEDEGGKWEGMHINRKIFNSQLLRRVKEQGVAVMYNEKVEELIEEDNRIVGVRSATSELRAHYVIDATGKKSLAGKKLKFKTKFYSPPLVCWTGVSGIFDGYPFDSHAAHFIPGATGWTWLAPQPPHYCAWTRLAEQGEKNLVQPGQMKPGIAFGKIIAANMRWRLFRPVCSEGIVLCGDAAGILDPAAGQGIFNALWSGIAAANAVVSCLQQPDFASFHLASYDNWFVEQFEMKAEKLKGYYQEQGISVFKEQGIKGVRDEESNRQ